MAGTFVAMYCHIIFSTKDRRPYLNDDVRARAHEYIGGIIRAQGSQPIIVGGADDHVHVLMGLNKQLALSSAVAEVKANSSRWIHETFAELAHFAWQPGYGAYSLHPDGIDKVKRYVRGQEVHHRDVDFRDEFRQFLDRFGMTYDVDLLWR